MYFTVLDYHEYQMYKNLTKNNISFQNFSLYLFPQYIWIYFCQL